MIFSTSPPPVAPAIAVDVSEISETVAASGDGESSVAAVLPAAAAPASVVASAAVEVNQARHSIGISSTLVTSTPGAPSVVEFHVETGELSSVVGGVVASATESKFRLTFVAVLSPCRSLGMDGVESFCAGRPVIRCVVPIDVCDRPVLSSLEKRVTAALNVTVGFVVVIVVVVVAIVVVIVVVVVVVVVVVAVVVVGGGASNR